MNNSNNVEQAARALLSPATSNTTRAAASHYLEQWTASEQAWPGFAAWLQHLVTATTRTETDNRDETLMSMTLLCLQLLQSKIRRSVPIDTTPPETIQPHASNILSSLAHLLHTIERRTSHNMTIISSACITLSALSVRCGQLNELFQHCISSLLWRTMHPMGHHQSQEPSTVAHFTPVVSLKLLCNIPIELETCALTTSQVTGTLSPYAGTLLETLRVTLLSAWSSCAQPPSEGSSPHGRAVVVVATALETLMHWIKSCHLSISALNAPPEINSHMCGNNNAPEPILPLMAQLLSTPPQNDDGDLDEVSEHIIVAACRALTEAVQVPTDACTESRAVACERLLLTPGFISVPLQVASRMRDGDGDYWDNACHALATLLSTIVCEQVDDLVTGSSAFDQSLQTMLLQLQQHPVLRVRMTVLEVWLTIQEVPTSQRGETWKKPLFAQVLTALLLSCQYPAEYDSDAGGWSDSIVEESEWKEYRQMATDVFASTYFLLRSDYVECCRSWITPVSEGDWRVREVGLYALTATARDVCARIKSGCGGSTNADGTKSLLATDRERTAQILLFLVQNLCGRPPDIAVSLLENLHAHVLAGTIDFVGSFAPAWKTLPGTADATLQLLAFLHRALSVREVSGRAAKSIRSLLISCSCLLLSGDTSNIPPLFQHLLESSIAIPDEDVLSNVIEGCTRLLVQVKDESVMREGFVKLIDPLIRSGNTTMQLLSALSTSDASMAAVESLGRCLHGLQVIIRFCDNATPSGNQVIPISDILNTVWQFLEKVSHQALTEGEPSILLQQVLNIHEQLLKTVPTLMASQFEQTITQVMCIFERSKDSATLRYVSRAVEVYGSTNVDFFRDLLNHVTTIVFANISSGDLSPDLLAAFFELNHRYLLYSPAALVGSSQFTATAAFAVECITACDGERESTRATLNFLTQLFGWRNLRTQPSTLEYLQGASQKIDELLFQLGGSVVSKCMQTLVGGPQMLWPPCTDCLFAVLTSQPAAMATPDDSTVGRQWLEASQPPESDSRVFQQVVSIFFELVADGSKNKAKVRMLFSDYGKIHAGELSVDSLIAYSFP